MEIHNLIEDVVFHFVDDLLSEKDDICKCHQCKLDIACYALNKIRPMYVVSSRGIIHSENDKRENNQKDIDVMSIVIEAVEVVSKTKRHPKITVEDNESGEERNLNGLFYHFPHIVGRVIDCKNFMPVEDAQISLYHDNGQELIQMINNRWKNPVQIVKAMDGTFTFCPDSIKAAKKGIQKDFQLNLEIKKDGYSPIRKYFEIRLISDIWKMKKVRTIYHLDDIYIFQEENQGA